MKRIILFILLLFGIGLSTFAKVSKDLWQLSASDYKASYVGAPVANGGIGILPWKEPFSVRQVILNHVFDENVKSEGISQVLKGINPFLLDMELNGETIDAACISNWLQVIDMKEAVHTTQFQVNDKAEIFYDIRALRNMAYAGMIRVKVKALCDLNLKVVHRMDVPDSYVEPQSYFRIRRPRGSDSDMDIFRISALSKYRGVEVAAAAGFFFSDSIHPKVEWNREAPSRSFTVQLKKGTTYCFSMIGSVCSSRDFYDPKNEAERQIIYALREGEERLLEAHRRLWQELWQGDIQIEGDDEAQRTVRFALYNLYSFAREGSGLSISPMGLSSQGYNGHIFWDAELWMYPPMLLLNAGIAESMMKYRTNRVDAARNRAISYGYRGVMFPWESDDSGSEACPAGALAGVFEHHITSCVGIACWNYYCVTRDKNWLRLKGYPLMREVAEFWMSRVTKNPDDSYSIRGVMGADEYAEWVDDNSFTNGAAICALRSACKAAYVCGELPPAEWKEVADRLRLLTFENGVNREHATYGGEVIKQADVNLLGYPLGIVSDVEKQRKDLDYYVERIDKKDGPAMGYSIFCIQYARLGDAENAFDMFNRCYKPNWRAPFGVLAESAIRQNPYFATGAGGLLQAVINGFCGLQITDDGIVQMPSVMPAHWKKIVITGVGPEKKTYIRTRDR